MEGEGQPRGEVGAKDQRSRVGSCTPIISSYFILAGPGHWEEDPAAGGATYTQSSHGAALLLASPLHLYFFPP